ncbi:MAG: terpene cyclase/mutase family protein, partial [Lentisphaeraceae bacterium]|nr:terpene cyclase/mutase family protein [Lentisphaeraceae bacterium]
MRSKIFLILLSLTTLSYGQGIFGKTVGEPVPPEVEKMYKKGLEYLVKNQQPNGTWGNDYYSREPGVVGLAILALLAHGEDPNFGPYSTTIKRAVDYLLKQQNSSTGMIGSSMYNHGFATLALAETYGALNEDKLGPALEKAVKLLLSSQARNPYNSWRYSPSGRDADTTAAGACMVALFAARNAGVGVPQSALEKG